MDVILSINDLV